MYPGKAPTCVPTRRSDPDAAVLLPGIDSAFSDIIVSTCRQSSQVAVTVPKFGSGHGM